MPLITKRSDIDDLLGGPTPAEEQLLAACMAGEVCVLGDGELPPEDAGPDREIRAKVLRYLILGGCEDCPVQGWGVQLYGALIVNQLDLSFQTAHGMIALMHCRFEEGVQAMHARFKGIYLNGSSLPGIHFGGVQIHGDAFLRDVRTTGEATLSGARIDGRVSLEGAKLGNSNGVAFNGPGLTLRNGLDAEGLVARGEINLVGASIAGQAIFDGAKLENEGRHSLLMQEATIRGGLFCRGMESVGELNLSGANVSYQLALEGAVLKNDRGEALNAQGARISGGFFWRDGAKCESGMMVLASAYCSDLADELSCWPEGNKLLLHGFTYDRIHTELDCQSRLKWLKNVCSWEGVFTPQPYTQLAKVYRKMGRDADARRVLFERQRLEWKDMQRRVREKSFGKGKVAAIWLGGQVSRWTVGYGYRPFNPLIGLIGLWALATFLAHMAWTTGTFAPNSGPVQVSAAWQAFISCEDKCPENPALAWSTQTQPGQDWETFNSLAYGADLVVPIIDFGQTDAWVPSTARGRWGTVLWGAGFLLNLAGWIITALGAAALTGIIQKERE